MAHVAKHAAEGLRFHDLRHCCATWLISDGFPMNDVARLLGHEQMLRTLNRYTHSWRDHYGRAQAVFADSRSRSAPGARRGQRRRSRPGEDPSYRQSFEQREGPLERRSPTGLDRVGDTGIEPVTSSV
ncbi:tyrosine-type recombinase/integrase [Microbispora sitophila]|uniref:tyrosine-type recombinase/integrase n=1 Tax=Microbispora sitophila TaxID=2771537 RepID=UPI003850822B